MEADEKEREGGEGREDMVGEVEERVFERIDRAN